MCVVQHIEGRCLASEDVSQDVIDRLIAVADGIEQAGVVEQIDEIDTIRAQHNDEVQGRRVGESVDCLQWTQATH